MMTEFCAYVVLRHFEVPFSEGKIYVVTILITLSVSCVRVIKASYVLRAFMIYPIL